MNSNASGTPQSMLYSARGEVPSNRDRSAEQRYSNSGNPMQPIFNTSSPTGYAQYGDMYGGQAPQFGRYTPPTLSNAGSSNSPSWNTSTGGYAYNLPNAYGGYQGTAMYPNQSWLMQYLSNGQNPLMPQLSGPSLGPAVPKPALQPAQDSRQFQATREARLPNEFITPIFNPSRSATSFRG